MAIKSVSELQYSVAPSTYSDLTLVNKKWVEDQFMTTTSATYTAVQAIASAAANAVSVTVDNKTITNGANGLAVVATGGLTTGNDGVKINLAENSGLSTTSGLAVGGGNGITVSGAYVAVDYDSTKGLTWSGSTNNSKKLAVNNGNGLSFASSSPYGLQVKQWNGIQVTSDGVAVRYDTSSTGGLKWSGSTDGEKSLAVDSTVSTAAHKVLRLNASGKIDLSVLPDLEVNNVFTATGTGNTGTGGMCSASNTSYATIKPKRGDICIVTTTGDNPTTTPYILMSGGDNSTDYQTLDNWRAITTAANTVTSFNGQPGAITLNNASTGSTTITIDNAKADGSTKGIAAFNSTHFTASSGIIDLKETYLTTAAASTDYQAKISTSGATSGQVLSWNGEAFTWVNQTSAYTLTAATDSALGGVSIPATATSYLTNNDGAIGVSIKTGGGLDYDSTTNASGIYVKITNKGTYAASTDYAIGDIVYCSKNSYYGSLPFIVKDKHTTGTSLTTMPTLTNASNTSTSGLKLTPLVLVASTSVSGVVMVNGTSTQMENGVLKVGLVENGGLTNITTGTSKGLQVDYELVADNILDSVGGFDSWEAPNDSAKTYYVGDVVHWEGSLYKCIQQYTTNTSVETREPGYAGGRDYWQETDFRNAYKYSGTATVATNNDAFIEIEHKLGTKDITVQVYQTDSADPDQETTRIPVLVEFEFGKTETYKSNLANNTNIIKKNNITLRFANSQSNSQYYRVVILAAR